MPLDQAKIAKLYPDSTKNFRWQHNTEGTVSNIGTKFVLGSLSSSGNNNHGQAKFQGYMGKRTDWNNTEAKIYFDADTGNDYLTISLGGGIESLANPCYGFAYKMSFSTNGKVRLAKQTYFIQYDIMKEVDIGPLPGAGEFKGIGFCRYNIRFGNAVRLEAWVDRNNDNAWKRVLTVVDNGRTYGKGGKRCGSITDTEAGTWGFPAIIFTNGNFTYNYKNMTAREINAGGIFNESGIAGWIPVRSGGGTPLPAF